MSLVIAIKDKDRIVLGSDTQASTTFNKTHDATKIWEVPGLPDAVMGSVGSMRAAQIIQYNNIIDMNDVCLNGVDTSYVINSLVPAITGCLASNGINTYEKNDSDAKTLVLPNTFIFAFEDKAWMIWNDLSVSELNDYLAIGSGSDVANGALYATKDKNPFMRIVTSIDAAAETTLFVDNGIDLLATNYFDEDEKLIRSALRREVEKVVKVEKTATEKKPTKKATKKTTNKASTKNTKKTNTKKEPTVKPVTTEK